MKEDEQDKISFNDEEKKLLNKYLDEYNDLYQKILILSESDFMENIKKKVVITIKSKIKNYSLKSIKKIEDYLKEEIYLPDYKLAKAIKKIILNRSKREKALHYFRGEIIPHCPEDKKDDYYIHTCGKRFQFFKHKTNNNLNNDLSQHNGIYYDYILYCIECNLIYKSSLIKFKCFNNDTEFYSKLLINLNEDDKSNENIYATWKKYHCNAIINDTMKCDKCEESFIFLQESNLLYCPSCKIKKNPLDITWKCIICQKEFQTEAKIYNPLEYKSLKICVKDAIVNKIKAKPEYMVCKCDIDIDNTIFFHKAFCKGELYLGEINSQKVIVCGKCDTLGLYEGYIWTCPNCMKRFKTKKREGSVCTKLGLTESPSEKKENFNKSNRNLSEKNSEKHSKIKSNIKELNNFLKEKNQTISNDNNTLNYLNDIKDNINFNNINNASNISKKRKINQVFKELFTSSFKEEKINKTNNFSFSEKCITNIHKFKTNLTNTSFNSQLGNNIISNSSKKELISRDKEENSNDSKFTITKYIINNYKKKNNFHIKNNFKFKVDKEKEIDTNSNSNFKKRNILSFPFTQSNAKFTKIQSESKDKNTDYKIDDFKSTINESNTNNLRKLSGYKKPYYSINNSYIKRFQKENNFIDKKKTSYIKGKKNNYNSDNLINDKENINNGIPYNKNIDEKKSIEDIENNNEENQNEEKVFSSVDDSKIKYKKKNNSKKYIYDNKERKINRGENKIIVKALNFAEMSIKDIDTNKTNYINIINENNIKDNTNQKLNSSLKLGKSNNININININNSANNINENEDNNELNENKRIFSNSIIMNNFTINDKNNILNSFSLSQNNNTKNYNSFIGKKNMNNINNINKINSNININNINNNLHYYNSINNNINNNKNYYICYKKKINNKNSETTTFESEKYSKKNNSSKNSNSINSLSLNNSSKKNRNTVPKYLFNPKYMNFSEYKLIKQIGKGSFGQIFMVENNQHQYFALKKLMASNIKDIKTLEHEYQILLDLQSCGKKINLVQIYGIETKQLDPTTFVMYVLMELASTDWEKEILSRRTMNKYYGENELMEIISSLITTFAQLQKEKISHRDIKPQNILIFKDSKTYKLGDFGEAKELLEDEKPTERQTLRGTELYMSPILFYALRSRQIIKYVKHNPYKSDLFSFGLCCLFAATLCFESIYDIRELRNNSAIKYIIQKYLGSRYSNVVINIICSMLDVNENSRNDFIEMEKEIKKIGY